MKATTALFCLSALPAFAAGTYPSGKPIDCYCTDSKGARVDLGETICMRISGREFLAQCQMSLNVPMWREVQQGCNLSSLHGAPHTV